MVRHPEEVEINEFVFVCLILFFFKEEGKHSGWMHYKYIDLNL